ncbi:MAG: hypothetical protein O6852_05390 [Gammaproteobacteria bacterium]|nr:hypothetical protein [Gammaproteobacteria bacterium]
MPGITELAIPAVYGDLAAGLLAFIALITLRNKWGVALMMVWIFNIVGTIDLLNARRHIDVAPNFGSAWYIPCF